MGLYEGLDIWQGLQHQQPLRPRCQPSVSGLVSQVGQHLVHLTQSFIEPKISPNVGY